MFGSTRRLRAPGFSVELSLLEFIKKDQNGLLLATAVISGAIPLWPFVRRSTGGPWVSISQATQLINREDALMLELRETGDHGTRKDKPLIVYDDGGERATKAAAALRKLGFGRVVNLTGGLGAWK